MLQTPHPGQEIRKIIESLREEKGKPLTIEEIATGLDTTRKTLSAIMNGKQAVTAEMAIKLAAAFRNTTALQWLNAQASYDLAMAKKSVKTKEIKVFVKRKVVEK